MDKQEFLERLKNPVRFEIRAQMKDFVAGIRYYSWDHILNISTCEKSGSHEVRIQMRDTRLEEQIKRSIIQYFPYSKDYRIVTGRPIQGYGPPDGDEVYTLNMAVVEEANYNAN